MLTRLAAFLLDCLLLVFLISPLGVWAQFDEVTKLSLTPQEIQKLRKVVDTPVDPGGLALQKDNIYRDKYRAAQLLGDVTRLDQIFHEWLKSVPNGAIRWTAIDWYWNKGKRNEALQAAQDRIKTSEWVGDQVRSRARLAGLLILENDLPGAAKLLLAAEGILNIEFKTISRQGATAYWLAVAELEFFKCKSELENALGHWHLSIENSKIAVSKGKEVFRLANSAQSDEKRMVGRSLIVSTQTQLASRQIESGLYSEAEWTFRETIKLIKEYGFNENMLPDLYNRLADLYLATGQFQEAMDYSQRGGEILNNQGVEGNSPKRLANQRRVHYALAALGRWSELLPKFDQIDAIVRTQPELERFAAQYDLRGFALLQNQRPADALVILNPHLQTQIELLGESHYYTAMTRGLFAAALAQTGDSVQARLAFENALRHLGAPDSMTGDFAETAFQRKTKRFILQNYMQLLSQTASTQVNDARTLFQVADRISSSSVQQALTEAAVRAGVKVPGLSDIIRKEQDARNEISSLNAYIAMQNSESPEKLNPQVVKQMRTRKLALEAQRKEFKVQIQKGYPEYFQLLQPKSPSHTDIAQQLKADELFVSILPMDDKTYVWAIDAQGEVHFHNAALSEADVKTLVTRIRKTLDVADLGNRAPSFDHVDSHRLYQEFFSPMESSLQGKTHLIVATNGAFAQLPLAVLTRSPTSASTPAAWLINDFAISHVPTANGWLSLKKLGQQPTGTQPLMAWGDPAFDPKVAQVAVAATGSIVRSSVGLRSMNPAQRLVMDAEAYVNYSKLPPLPETRDEVLELAKIMQANPAQDVILGADATRQSVLNSSASGLLGKKQVVVFATHGLLAGDLPFLNQPALAMAGTSNPNESPLLTLEDVLSLKLNADWVVLSACNTAGADGKAEEALSGLARGFFFAGSRSLLVTHWSVESESAMLLTTHTFAAYKNNPSIRRADALRQAMLETMKSPAYAHPTYWAPYALVGEGGR